MSLNYTPQTVTAEQYERLFEAERKNVYPAIDAVERDMGVAVDRDRLEKAARVLACPMKAQPPNWQHGRVIYAVTRAHVESLSPSTGSPITAIDIGTAKGFSALCLLWAIEDALGETMVDATVTSVDVMPPSARVRRNTVAEVDGLRTLDEILSPFPEAKRITFLESTGTDYLRHLPKDQRIHVAFVDGKHSFDAVWHEGLFIAHHQQPDDVVIFDDHQVPGVAEAIRRLKTQYAMEIVKAKPGREYVIARRQ